MAFASVHVPNFMVQAVVRGEARPGGCGMALVDGTPPLVRVVAGDEAALRAGVQVGMAKLQAALCGVEICARSREREKAAHAALLDLGWSISPRVEDLAADTIVVDVAGLGSLFGSEENIAREMVRRAAGLRLVVQVAISANLETAVHAGRGFPGITLIPEGEEEKCLGNLPVGALSPSLEALETLRRWGIRNCKGLAALPVLELSERLGQEGVRLHELARGARARAMVLTEPVESMEEAMELEDAVEDLEPLSFLLGRLLDQMCARLEARSLAAAAIRVRFELGDLFAKDVQVRGESAVANSADGAEAAETLCEGVAAAGADAGFQDAFEIAAAAASGGPACWGHCEDCFGGGAGAGAVGAGRVVCAGGAGSGEIGVDGGAFGEIGWRGEYRVAGIGGYASSGGISDEEVCGGGGGGADSWAGWERARENGGRR